MSHAQMFVVNCNDDVTLDKLMVGRLFLFWKEGKNVKQCCFETLKSFSQKGLRFFLLFSLFKAKKVSGTLRWRPQDKN